MLSVITELVLGVFVLSGALVWWQHDIDLRAMRRDFEAVRQKLEEAGLLGNGEGGVAE